MKELQKKPVILLWKQIRCSWLQKQCGSVPTKADVGLGWPGLSPCIKSMRLETRQERVGSSLRVSGVCQDDAREFAKRRPRLTGRLSGVAKKLVGSRDDDAVGSRRKFARRFAEGIGKLTRNVKEDRRKEDRRTYHKIAGGCQSMRDQLLTTGKPLGTTGKLRRIKWSNCSSTRATSTAKEGHIQFGGARMHFIRMKRLKP
ncbi:hypothetical protein GW17_00018243 [Ensete ventricosum]|nr:hypothetical protein GW17_00018243 [Ensete ventricosum]